jgi:hypothetical protein
MGKDPARFRFDFEVCNCNKYSKKNNNIFLNISIGYLFTFRIRDEIDTKKC